MKKLKELIVEKEKIAIRINPKNTWAEKPAFHNHNKVNRPADLKTTNEELNQVDKYRRINLKEISDYKYAVKMNT